MTFLIPWTPAVNLGFLTPQSTKERLPQGLFLSSQPWLWLTLQGVLHTHATQLVLLSPAWSPHLLRWDLNVCTLAAWATVVRTVNEGPGMGCEPFMQGIPAPGAWSRRGLAGGMDSKGHCPEVLGPCSPWGRVQSEEARAGPLNCRAGAGTLCPVLRSPLPLQSGCHWATISSAYYLCSLVITVL